jgi:uncharacterized protein (TIGR03000 family)
VSLPAEAKLSIDGSLTKSASARRVFISPALEIGKTYQYTLTGEVVRDGKTVTASKVVEVRPGEETQVTLDFSERIVAQR